MIPSLTFVDMRKLATAVVNSSLPNTERSKSGWLRPSWRFGDLPIPFFPVQFKEVSSPLSWKDALILLSREGVPIALPMTPRQGIALLVDFSMPDSVASRPRPGAPVGPACESTEIARPCPPMPESGCLS